MSSNSNFRGRAYEYAWINTLHKTLQSKRKTKIVENSSLEANKKAWKEIDSDLQQLFLLSAEATVNTILELEPRIIEDDNDELILEFQKDNAGINGDVRDIVIKRDYIKWEVGLSIKHNHEAVKHSRLSYKLDFGNSM